MLSRLAHSIMLAWGITRALIAFAIGAVSALALPPVSLWPILFLTFPMLVWLIDGAAGRGWRGLAAAAATGWCFGFGYFLAGLYWVGYAFLVDAKTFGWLLPIAVTALPAGLALFTALGTALARLLWTPDAWRIVTLAAALTLSEWLRGHLFTGFPWNAFGDTLTTPLVLAQSASLIGLWGMTFAAIAIFASPAVLADDRANTPRPWLAPAGAALVLAAMAVFGSIRLERTPTRMVDGVHLRIMQPNLQQDDKFNYSAKQKVMSLYLKLSDAATGPRSAGIADITHLIWPESAFPFFLAREGDALAEIANLLPPGAVLITGAARPAERAGPNAPVRAYNSVYVIDHDGTILSVYDKVHLVPFGEYLPFQDQLERWGLSQLTKLRGGFIPGDRHRAYDIPRAPRFLPLICYEVIFPGEAVPAGERPAWLVNLTNDGWFGNSPGPYQHFQQARLRAIEEGLPLVRAANTGISAVIDPLGRVIAMLPLGQEGILDAGLPASIESTFYARMGNRHTILVLAAIFLVVTVRRFRRS